MAASEKRIFSPAFTGLSCTSLLIVSRLLSQYSDLVPQIGALNTVLYIIAMCECVHLVRVSSALAYSHVWDSRQGVLLFSMPVVNLLVTAVQLFKENSTVTDSSWFIALLTLFSLPAFFCYYFAFYLRVTGRKRSGMKRVLTAVGLLYTAIRILDKALLPFIAVNTTISVPLWLTKAVSYSSKVSFATFIVSAVGFVLMMITYGRRRRR